MKYSNKEKSAEFTLTPVIKVCVITTLFFNLSHAHSKELKSLTNDHYEIPYYPIFTSEILQQALILVELGNTYFIVFEMFKGIERNVEDLYFEFCKNLIYSLGLQLMRYKETNIENSPSGQFPSPEETTVTNLFFQSQRTYNLRIVVSY